MAPGELGENITASGIDLLGLPVGVLTRIGADAVLEVAGRQAGTIDVQTMLVQTDGAQARWRAREAQDDDDCGDQMAGPKTERIGLRATPEQRSLLEAASRAEGITVTDFVLEHATTAAENVLADRRVFVLNEQTWAEFVGLLDRPAREVAGLRDLMTGPSVLDDDE